MQSAWKYVNEPRVIFHVRVGRGKIFPNGGTTKVGIPESLAGNPKMERKWILYELQDARANLVEWKMFHGPNAMRKNKIL